MMINYLYFYFNFYVYIYIYALQHLIKCALIMTSSVCFLSNQGVSELLSIAKAQIMPLFLSVAGAASFGGSERDSAL